MRNRWCINNGAVKAGDLGKGAGGFEVYQAYCELKHTRPRRIFSVLWEILPVVFESCLELMRHVR